MIWRRKTLKSKHGAKSPVGRLLCVLYSQEYATWCYGAGEAAGTRLRCSVHEECLRRREIVDIIYEDGGKIIERYDGAHGRIVAVKEP